jgi:hypothetical protein
LRSIAADSESAPSQTALAAERAAEALQAEIDGDFLKRQRLLAEVSGFRPVQWQTGHVFEAGKWLEIEESVEQASQKSELDQYERRRAVLTDTLSNHMSLAVWCASKGLADRCRSHLNRVLEFDSDNSVARMALGYQLVNGRWMSPNEQARLAQQTQFAMSSHRRFAATVRDIRKDLSSSSTDVVHAARERLQAIDDPTAIPSVESIFSNSNHILASYALDWLGQLDCIESTRALARFALSHPLEPVRRSATQHLTDRPLFDYVPDMLKLLESPVAMTLIPSFDPQGNLLGYRQAFARERIDKTELLVLDRVFQRSTPALPNAPVRDRTTADLNAIVADAIQESALQQFAAGESLARQQVVQRENFATASRNARVADVLSQVAGREFEANPKPLWDWWDEYCETEYQREKPLDYRRTFLADRVARYREPLPVSSRVHECFVAGTQVMTERGLKPIEQIVVGDRVLSQSSQTAELSWKPVLRCTTRPPKKTITIQTDESFLTCTTGHLFWVSGRGWQKASQLRSGDVLRAARTPAVVLSVNPSAVQETYNLQVADNATYFVGKGMVLTHDVTPRTADRQRVPGEQLIARLMDQGD